MCGVCVCESVHARFLTLFFTLKFNHHLGQLKVFHLLHSIVYCPLLVGFEEGLSLRNICFPGGLRPKQMQEVTSSWVDVQGTYREAGLSTSRWRPFPCRRGTKVQVLCMSKGGFFL